MKLESAEKPTFYFIGVTTSQSSIMTLFPQWSNVLAIDAVIKGIDIEIHANPQIYREVVQFIKDDPLSMGALITTHKIDMYNAAHDLFDYLDPYAQDFKELSCISKKNGRLEGYAKDPISSGLAMEAFIPKDYWKNYQGEVFLMGAGGSAIAICAYLLNHNAEDNLPAKFYVSNRSQARLNSMSEIIGKINDKGIVFEYILVPELKHNDEILSRVKAHSLIVNATGLGKDRPGSPLTDFCQFPENSLIWELNYRGDLTFKYQALKQQVKKNLHIEDGWIYFIHGWTQVISEVFHVDINETQFMKLEEIANNLRK